MSKGKFQVGPGTIAESLIRGLPIILNDYIPRQISVDHTDQRAEAISCSTATPNWTVHISDAKSVLSLLDLTKCKDSKIGKPMLIGFSTGERKRVTIGQEMLINPTLFFR
ncbi:hypothetical protein RYX36_036228 [Vicia faba]